MNKDVRAFFEAAKADSELRGRLSKMTVGELVAAAKGKGFELAEADFAPSAGELDEGELENVAGGGYCLCVVPGGGGGTDGVDGKVYGCACVVYGQGGDGNIADANCACAIGGEGKDDNNWFIDRSY